MLKPLTFAWILFLSASLARSVWAAPCVPSGPGKSDYARCREEVEARRKSANELMREAEDMQPPERAPKQREAAEMLLDAWSDGFGAACRAGEAKRCEGSDEILFQAALAFRWSGDKRRAREVRAMLLDPKNGLADSRMGTRALYDEAVDAWLTLDFERAASGFETFAAKQPKDDSASDALENALVYRVALGDLDEAEKILDTLARSYGNKSFLALDFLTFGLADAFARNEDWSRVERFLAARERVFEKSRDELRLQVGALRGRALAKQGKTAPAEAAFKRVAGAPLERLRDQASGPGGDRSLGRALEAIGEAKLFFADQAAADYFKLTVKKGDKPSLEKKESALSRAEKAYLAVLQLTLAPPPRQTVVAGARVARMYGQLWAQTQIAFGDAMAEPYLARAKAANKTCVEYAARFQVVDPGAAACSAWLTRHYASEYHAVGELVPVLRPDSGERPPPPVLGEDGAPVVPITGDS